MGFLTTQQNLPPQTFVSADAVSWLMTHMEGGVPVEKAIEVGTTNLCYTLFFFLFLKKSVHNGKM